MNKLMQPMVILSERYREFLFVFIGLQFCLFVFSPACEFNHLRDQMALMRRVAKEISADYLLLFNSYQHLKNLT